ncbi:hypothetical protein [Bifidobacterium longum]|uniref:hypothetical protein n=1 Tax=Bifidobacterium longum TaxID=216816 RepID=UPI00321BBABE
MGEQAGDVWQPTQALAVVGLAVFEWCAGVEEFAGSAFEFRGLVGGCGRGFGRGADVEFAAAFDPVAPCGVEVVGDFSVGAACVLEFFELPVGVESVAGGERGEVWCRLVEGERLFAGVERLFDGCFFFARAYSLLVVLMMVL